MGKLEGVADVETPDRRHAGHGGLQLRRSRHSDQSASFFTADASRGQTSCLASGLAVAVSCGGGQTSRLAGCIDRPIAIRRGGGRLALTRRRQ